jgi:hypothetical protein
MDFQLPQTLLGWLGLAAIIIPIAITAMGFRPAVAFLKNHMNDQLFGILRKWAYTYVAALAQDPTLKGLASEAKKQQAVIWLVYKAKELGIALTEQEASQMVEEAVYLVKSISLPRLEDALELNAG